MAYAGWTKGSSALQLAMRAPATAPGVEHDLVAEWARFQPDLVAVSGWRWISEMDEIAASLDAVGMPDGCHTAAAEVYRRMAHLRHAGPSEVQLAVNALRDPDAMTLARSACEHRRSTLRSLRWTLCPW